ncbi:MAG: hypothetical protein UHM85_09620 [Acutalibacteraceae bacterium]|nr:hypothetical protein [Acutalibacteraceae bacterium]
MAKNTRMKLEVVPMEPEEYVINGVKYIVESRFAPIKIKDTEPTLKERFAKTITSDFVCLTENTDTDILDTNYVCSTAGKED